MRYIGSGDFIGTGNALDNLLAGSAGNDVLTGGLGADTFVYDGGGADTITDFTHGVDVIALSGIASFEPLMPHMLQQGDDVLLDLGGTLRLIGVDLGSLTAGDFLFA